MANKKRLWNFLGILCLAVCLCIGLTACNGQETTGTQQSTTQGTSGYTLQVETVGVRLLENVSVYVYTDDTLQTLQARLELDASGSVAFSAPTSDSYCAVLMGLPAGYAAEAYYPLQQGTTQILLKTAVITDTPMPENLVYSLGDVVYDFSVKASDGKTYQLSRLLQEKDAVVLNFWYLSSDSSKMELPFLEMAAADYADSIAVLAINCEDGSEEELRQFARQYGLTIPLAVGDKAQWSPLAYQNCPTTMIIDRYGTVVFQHSGAFTETAPFDALFRAVTGSNYQQVLIEDIDSLLADVQDRPDGSQKRPFEMGGAVPFQVELPKENRVYYALYRMKDVTLRIADPDIYVIVEGRQFDPVNGVIEVELNTTDNFTPLQVVFGTSSTEDQVFTVEFVFKPGNVSNPIRLALGENRVEVENVNDLGVYYTYTATDTGELILAVLDCTKPATADIYLYNETTQEAVHLSTHGALDPDTGLRYVSIPVEQGHKVQIIFSASTESGISISAATIHAHASIKKGSGIIDGKTNYSVRVVDQKGKPMANVEFYLSAGENSTTLRTDAQGMAEIRLPQGAYLLELVMPAGFTTETNAYLWSPAIPALTIRLTATTTYSVKLETDEGKPLENVMVKVFADKALNRLMFATYTDEKGEMAFVGAVDTAYYLVLETDDPTFVLEDYYTVEGKNAVITVETAQQLPVYQLGDTVEDFTITDIDGRTHSLQQLLQKQDAVLLTFWKNGSDACVEHLTALQKAYETFGDRIAVLALNPTDDTVLALRSFRNQHNLTFPLAQCEESWIQRMALTDYPTTVIIDREGKIALIHTGAITEERVYTQIESVFTDKDYVHTPFRDLEALMQHSKKEN